MLSACALLLLASASTGAMPRNTHGMAESDIDKLSSSEVFSCKDGSAVLPIARLNDDFCDCADGSDEPGTSACAGTGTGDRFYCTNQGHLGRFIPSSRVGDGVCDCCDGSDEQLAVASGGSVECPNTCDAAKSQHLKDRAAHILREEAGARAKIEYAKQGRGALATMRARTSTLRGDIDQASAKLSQLREQLSEAEAEESAERRQRRDAAEGKLWSALRLTDVADANELRRMLVDLAVHFEDSGGKDALKDLLRAVVPPLPPPEDAPPTPLDGGTAAAVAAAAAVENVAEVSPDGSVVVDGASIDEDGVLIGGSDAERDAENDAERDADIDLDDATQDDYAGADGDGAEEEEDNTGVHWPEDEDTYESAKAVETRDAIQKAEDEERRLTEEMDGFIADFGDSGDEAAAHRKFGDNLEWWPLKGKCISHRVAEYTYEACPFDRALQGSTSLGHWEGWKSAVGEQHQVTDDPSEHGYRVMRWGDGQGCWQGPNRELELEVRCGTTDALLSLEEPSKCVYRGVFQSPAACNLAAAGELKLELLETESEPPKP